MSLFGIKNWWKVQCTDLDENYDVHNLLCTRFGAQKNESSDYIVTSSHGGYLTIFYPSAQELNEGGADVSQNKFKETDLLYETRFEAPVLGIYAGKFTSNSNVNDEQTTNQLVILHPYTVVIYKVVMVMGVAEHGSQMSLQPLAKYQLSRVAFDFCQGHFGHVEGREFFCVSHIDGSLTFFEQDGISYQCLFPNCRNILSPVVYCDNSDCFLRFTNTWHLECYRYQDLAQSSFSQAHYEPIWSVCVGECILDMRTVRAKSDCDYIMIMGEHNFFILNDSGKLEKTLKLNYVPKCFCTFLIGYYWEPTARLITAIVSQDSRLNIYENTQLIWAAKDEETSIVALQRAHITSLAGCIVTLGACGQLCLGYLGTRPFVFDVPQVEIENMNLNDSYAEMLKLEEEIKENMDVQNMSGINKKSYEDVRVHFVMSDEVSESIDDMLMEISAAVAVNEFYSATAQFRFKCYIDIAELQLTFKLPEGIHCNMKSSSYNNLTTGTSKILELNFFIADILHVASTNVTAIISYITQQGFPRVIKQSAHLPLRMFYKACSPQKSAGLQLTLNFSNNLPNPKLSQLFPEFLGYDADTQSLGLALLLCPDEANQIVSIIMSSDFKRLRIQSDTLEALSMILERVVEKFEESQEMPTSAKKSEKQEQIGILITVTPQLLVTEILKRLNEHHNIQLKIRQLTTILDDLWQGYKDMQKQTQENYETITNESQTLQMEEMYDRFILEGDKLTVMRKDEKVSQCSLNCAITLVKLLLPHLSHEKLTMELFSAILCTPIVDWLECSWEEAVYPSIEMFYQNNLMLIHKGKDVHEPLKVISDQYDFDRFRILLSTLLEYVFVHGTKTTTGSASQSLRVHTNTETNIMQNNMKISHSVEYNNMQHAKSLYPIKSTRRTPLQSEFMHMASTAVNVAASKSGVELKDLKEEIEGEKREEEEMASQKLVINNDLHDKIKNLHENKINKERLKQQEPKRAPDAVKDGAEMGEEEETSEWVNENYQLPSSEELFSDLGIWW